MIKWLALLTLDEFLHGAAAAPFIVLFVMSMIIGLPFVGLGVAVSRVADRILAHEF